MSSNIDLLFNKLNGRYFNNFISKRNKIMSEEDLRVAFSSLIDFICNENNIEIPEERHEYSVYKGRIDSLYGEIILEYKSPNFLDFSNLNVKNIKAIGAIIKIFELIFYLNTD